MKKNSDVMIVSNWAIGDTTFDTDTGSWNITRAIRDCNAGKHKTYNFNIDEVYPAILNVDVEKKKIKAMLSKKKLVSLLPLIFVVEHGKVWLIDGHHRVHAMKKLGIKVCSGYVIEQEDSAPYIIWYNGERVSPWYGRDNK